MSEAIVFKGNKLSKQGNQSCRTAPDQLRLRRCVLLPAPRRCRHPRYASHRRTPANGHTPCDGVRPNSQNRTSRPLPCGGYRQPRLTGWNRPAPG